MAAEEVLGNRIGSGVYRRWVDGLALQGRERMLEIGTGGGACARHLAAALPEGHLTCVELDGRWLQVARRRLARFAPRVELIVADAAEWARPDSFDAAVSHFVLHDVAAARRTAVLDNVTRSLVPGGHLHVREPLGHGMSLQELRRHLDAVGLTPVGQQTLERVPLMGETVSGTWRR